jgi:hypothetical protein
MHFSFIVVSIAIIGQIADAAAIQFGLTRQNKVDLSQMIEDSRVTKAIVLRRLSMEGITCPPPSKNPRCIALRNTSRHLNLLEIVLRENDAPRFIITLLLGLKQHVSLPRKLLSTKDPREFQLLKRQIAELPPTHSLISKIKNQLLKDDQMIARREAAEERIMQALSSF